MIIVKLNKLETEELEKTGYVVTDNYCVTLNSDGEYELFKKVKGLWQLDLNSEDSNNDWKFYGFK